MSLTQATGSQILDGSITEVDIGLSDITTNNATTTKHGFLQKLPNNANVYLNGAGSFTAPTKSVVGLGNVDNTSDSTKNSASVTLSNKTLTKPVTNASVQGMNIPTVVVGGMTICDLSLANIFNLVMGAGNTTISLSNASVGQVFMLNITQDSSGGRTVVWFTTIKWVGGIIPTLTTTANKRDCFGFICTGTNTYDGFIIGQNI